ncbi:hypothetical protein [Pseudomonas sp. RIT-To-2]|uniref:hypothetical protein n=1 Tax=Pseudomonas sp. RIT-To-2 TaxID=3462541 RepID=UPI0024131F3C
MTTSTDSRSSQLDTNFGNLGIVNLPPDLSGTLVGQRIDAGGTIVVCYSIDQTKVRLALFNSKGEPIDFANGQSKVDVDLQPTDENNASVFTPTQIITGDSQKIYVVGTMYIASFLKDTVNPVVFCLKENGDLDTEFGPSRNGIVHFEVADTEPPAEKNKTWIDSSGAHGLVKNPHAPSNPAPRAPSLRHLQKLLGSSRSLRLPPAFQAVTRETDLLLTFSTLYVSNAFHAGLVICLNEFGRLKTDFDAKGYTFLAHNGRPTYFSAITYNPSTSQIIVGGGDLDPGDIKGDAIVCGLDPQGVPSPSYGINGWTVVDNALYGAQIDWLTNDNINRTFGVGASWDRSPGFQQALLVGLESNGTPLSEFAGGKIRFSVKNADGYATCVVSTTEETTVLFKPSFSGQFGLARYTRKGAPAQFYGENGQLIFPEGAYIINIRLQSDNKLLLIREEDDRQGHYFVDLYRYLP